MRSSFGKSLTAFFFLRDNTIFQVKANKVVYWCTFSMVKATIFKMQFAGRNLTTITLVHVMLKLSS